MQNWSSLIIVTLLASFAGILSTGCDSTQNTQADSKEFVFFPQPPDPPRFQFVTSFSRGSEMAKRKEDSTFTDWLVGTTEKQKSSDRFDSPYGAAAFRGSIYVCDVGYDRVHVVDLVKQEYRTLQAPDGIKNPVNITIAPDGTKYVCDTGQRMILVFDINDQFVTLFGHPQTCNPIDVAVYGDELFVADASGGEVEVWSKTGEVIRVIGRKGSGPDEMENPTNLDIGPDKRLYVTDSFLQIIKVYDLDGNFVDTIGGPGQAIGRFSRPKGITVDPNGAIFVADAVHDTVQIFNSEGNLLMLLGTPGDKPYSMGIPAGLSIDTTSIDAFSKYISPDFQAEYLLFVVNQFGVYKIAVFAYGSDKSLAPEQYEIDMEKIEKIREERARGEEELPTDTSTKQE